MNNQVQTLKGFRDFLGEEARKRQWLTESIRNVFERYGYEPLETPALEYESLLLGKYGTEADKLIYGFEDRGGRRVALRYDQTIPVARVVAQYQNQLVLPYKRYQMQPVWRAENPQKGRYREFLQSDIDILGTSSVASDAEVIAVFVAIFQEIGINSLQIKINDRKTLLESIKKQGIPDDKVFTVIQTLDKLDKKSKEEVISELVAKGIEEQIAKDLIDSLGSLEMPENLSIIKEITESMGVPKDMITYTPTLARGLDYYTGMIFEGVIPEYSGGSVGGGGRYDDLIKQLVGVDMPAVGFALGFDRTLEAIEQLGKIPASTRSSKVLVTVFSQELADRSMEVADTLRTQNIPTEIYLDANKKLDVQLKYANRKQIPFVIIVGPDEAEKKIVKIKNMKTGEQKEAPLEEIEAIIQT